MSNIILLILSFIVGILVVIQGSVNARLGILLNNVILASTTTLLMSASFTIIVAFVTVRQFPSEDQLQSIPAYMWLTGGVLSFFAVTLFYYIIPRLGISTAVTFGLAGQILFAAIAGHFGWFGMPVEPFTFKKIIGITGLIISVAIIKSEGI